MILAIVLAPTDAALAQAVVTEPRVPGRVVVAAIVIHAAAET